MENGTDLRLLLRGLRQRALLTQEELAERSGVSVGTIAGLESGRTRRPRSGSIRLLADALGLSGEEREELAAAALSGPAGDRRTPSPVPAQLPPDLAEFAGRGASLRQLDELLSNQRDAVTICTITGTAGVGKTTLAVRWAHSVADRFPDGSLYVNLRGFDPTGSAMDPGEALRGFLDALGVAPERVPAGLDAQSALYRSLLAGSRMLVVLDNARDAAQVRPLLPAAPGCLVVVTSRNELPGLVAAEGARPVTLDLLSAGEARELLVRRLGRDRVGPSGAVEEIVRWCAGLPLALAIVAARASGHPRFPLSALAEELRETRGGLDLPGDEDPAIDLRAVFSWSYRALRPAAARLFRLLGCYYGPDISLAAVTSLAGAPSRAELAELTRAHLVTAHTPGRYALHDLLRAYANGLARTHDDPVPAQRRLFDHYLHTAYEAATRLNPHRDPVPLDPPAPGVEAEPVADPVAALAWFSAEAPSALAAIEQGGAGFDRQVWLLAWAFDNFLQRQGHWRQCVLAHRAALGAAERLGDRPGQAYSHRFLGRAYARLTEYPASRTHLHRARQLFEELGDAAGQGNTHLGMAWALEKHGAYGEALEHSQKALAHFEAAGHRAGVANALNMVGWYQAHIGEYGEAVLHCERALAMHRELGYPSGESSASDSLGYAYLVSGDHGRAVALFLRALELRQGSGETYGTGEVLLHLGDAYAAAGDAAAARGAWSEALAIFADLNHPDAEALRERLAGRTGQLDE